jgi:uncharacterized protein (TIGR02118 family)
MIKIVVLIKRKPGLTREEFSTYYFEKHAALARRVIPPEISAGITHYVQNHTLDVGTSDPPYDCVTEIGFVDRAAMERWDTWYRGTEGKVLRDDEDTFADQSLRIDLVTRAVRPGARNPEQTT